MGTEMQRADAIRAFLDRGGVVVLRSSAMGSVLAVGVEPGAKFLPALHDAVDAGLGWTGAETGDGVRSFDDELPGYTIADGFDVADLLASLAAAIKAGGTPVALKLAEVAQDGEDDPDPATGSGYQFADFSHFRDPETADPPPCPVSRTGADHPEDDPWGQTQPTQAEWEEYERTRDLGVTTAPIPDLMPPCPQPVESSPPPSDLPAPEVGDAGGFQ